MLKNLIPLHGTLLVITFLFLYNIKIMCNMKSIIAIRTQHNKYQSIYYLNVIRTLISVIFEIADDNHGPQLIIVFVSLKIAI